MAVDSLPNGLVLSNGSPSSGSQGADYPRPRVRWAESLVDEVREYVPDKIVYDEEWLSIG